SIQDIDGASDQTRRLRSQMGNRASRVETAMHHQEGVRIDLKQILSRYEDADAIEAFNDIVQQETAFQAALNVTSKVSKLSILDYM
ncbi:MAG TPA: flagellar hook-associated protein 3, partial [Desulfobulbus sp.]|nr:flagellar hook-associated protein 3 [Desulfobulbus sp.]